jgi:RimJ/RimL family protein N-acetyltransferase
MISTDRLRIREFADADFSALAALVSNAEVMKFSDGVESQTAARERLAGYQRSYVERGFGKWAVEEKAGGRVIGYCGFGVEVFDGEASPELGFRLFPEFWGLGLATEAALACERHAFTRLGFRRYLGFAHPENVGSLRVLEKLGMRLIGDRSFHGGPVVVYEQTSPFL